MTDYWCWQVLKFILRKMLPLVTTKATTWCLSGLRWLMLKCLWQRLKILVTLTRWNGQVRIWSSLSCSSSIRAEIVLLTESRAWYKSCTLPLPGQPFTLTEIITMAIIGALLLVAAIFAVTTCAVRARSYKMEGHQPLLVDQYQRYDSDKSQSVVWDVCLRTGLNKRSPWCCLLRVFISPN